MPLSRFRCPDSETIECAKCISEGGCRMSSRCCSRPTLKLMYNSQREWKGVPSTTQLIKGTMSSFLELKHEYAGDPDKMVFMLFGTQAHERLEQQGDDVSKAELDYSDANGSIRPDVIETENGINTLLDYKFCGSYQVAKALGIYFEDIPVLDPITHEQRKYKTGAKKGQLKTRKEKRCDPQIADLYDWALQLNNYRIGIESGKVLKAPDGKFYLKKFAPEGSIKIKIHKMTVQANVRDGGTVVAIGRGVDKNKYLINVPRVADKDILEYFKRKKDDLLKAVSQGHWLTPCNDHERWNDKKCTDYCNVNIHCPYWVEKYSKNIDTEEANDTPSDLNEDGSPK